MAEGADFAKPDVLRLCRATQYQGFYGWKATHTLGATGKIRFDEVTPPRSLDFLQTPEGVVIQLPNGDPLGLPLGV